VGASEPRAPNDPARGSGRRVSAGTELEAHEALLRRAVPAFRVGVLDRPALSYGVGVPEEAAYAVRARRAGVATFPRTSGGSGVLHAPGDLVWALVLPRSDPRVGRDFARAYGRLGRAIVAGLEGAGVPTRWLPAPGLSESYCPLSSRGEVLVASSGIVGGAAQHATGSALLHQGFVAWEVDRAAVDRLFDLPPGGPSARLGGVEPVVPGLTPERLAGAVAEALAHEVAG
jgi:lipoate-protein ligase A